MNLIYLHQKSDPVLKLGDGVAAKRVTVSGRTYDGFLLPNRVGAELRLTSALRWHPFATRPLATDWLAVTTSRSAIDLEVALVSEAGETVSRIVDRIGSGPSVVSLPTLFGPSTLNWDRSLDLVLRNRAANRSPTVLLVAEIDNAKPFLGLAKGMGVELLNGRAKSLAPTAERDLFYVGSEAQIAAAATSWPVSGDRWCQALVGGWHDIPVVDNELDFIFANNVMHRAVNPLGHLRRWRAKLRNGGRVLATVPYLAGGSDYLNAPTAMADWITQYESGGFQETQAHHDAFARARGLNPKSLFRRGYASSFSFFTPSNIADMLNFAVERLGYEGLHIEHVRNGSQIRFGLYA